MDTDAASVSSDLYRISDDWISRAGRAGYVTKGVVYAVVGILALRASFGAGGSTEGTQGAILEIADQPFGQVLLALTAVGLFAYALWRFVEALLDPRHAGTDAKGLIERAGYVVSGLIYLGLAVWAAWIILGTGSQGSSGGDSQQQWTAALLSQPSGQWLLAAIGAVVVGVGLYHFYNAYNARFMKRYEVGAMSARQRRWARRIGRFGISARGITFAIIGTFVIQAARQSDPSEVEGLAGALQTLAEQPYGPWVLAVVAIGFIAYGIYCGSQARYSHFSAR